MPINTLLKSDEIKKQKKVIAIDYSKIDPQAIKKTSDADIKVEELLKDAEMKSTHILENARIEAERLVEEAKKEADTRIQASNERLAQEREIFEKEINQTKELEERKIAVEKEQLEKMRQTQIQEIESKKEEIRASLEAEVWQQKRDEATEKIEDEISRIVSQVHAILNEAIDRRKDILGVAEEEITELVILIARKVVKVLSENDNNVVIENIVQALSKLKGRERFLIRVNLKNLDGLQEYILKIKERLEITGNISVVEDTSVDVGGCIIETEFGEIDARISTQLKEIESRIRDSGLVRNVKF